MQLHLPPAYPSDRPASPSQRDSVERFYRSTKFGDLSDGQAGDLLDIREFARAVVDRLRPPLEGNEERAVAEAVAVFISRNREYATGVVAMMRRRFDKGADPDTLKRAVTKLDGFDYIEDFADQLTP